MILSTTIKGLFFGSIGTLLGGLLGISVNNISNKILSFILSFASGLMLSIICFDLLPEANKLSSITIILIGTILGVVTMFFCDSSINTRLLQKNETQNSLLRTGIAISIGLALHNIPEGLAIGTGFSSSLKLGLSLAITIAIHDIPEGISMSIPLKACGLRKTKIIFYVLLSGIATGIGALIGVVTVNISHYTIPVSIAFAAGAMLYIVSGELTPEYSKLYSGKFPAIGNILGFLLGYIATQII